MNQQSTHIGDKIDDLLDGTLNSTEKEAVDSHLACCAQCREALVQERALRQALVNQSVPPMRPGFAATALRRARNSHEQAHHHGFKHGFASAIAATITLLALGLFFYPNQQHQNGIAPLTFTVGELKQVNLAFNSPVTVQQATLTIELPDGTEVDGYPGQHQLVWQIDLHSGTNRLTLPLRVTQQAQGELVARLHRNNQSKIFRLPLRVLPMHQSRVMSLTV